MPLFPITIYMKQQREAMEIVRRLTTYGLYEVVRDLFWCGAKMPFSRRAARRIKRDFNARLRGSASIGHCRRCKRYHVWTVFERLDVVQEAEFRLKVLSSEADQPWWIQRILSE